MAFSVLNYIEVKNKPNEWAVELNECKKEFNPVKTNFIFVYNEVSDKNNIYIENIIQEHIPEKVIDGITGSISEDFIEVGFWRVKTFN